MQYILWLRLRHLWLLGRLYFLLDFVLQVPSSSKFRLFSTKEISLHLCYIEKLVPKWAIDFAMSACVFSGALAAAFFAAFLNCSWRSFTFFSDSCTVYSLTINFSYSSYPISFYYLYISFVCSIGQFWSHGIFLSSNGCCFGSWIFWGQCKIEIYLCQILLSILDFLISFNLLWTWIPANGALISSREDSKFCFASSERGSLTNSFVVFMLGAIALSSAFMASSIFFFVSGFGAFSASFFACRVQVKSKFKSYTNSC